jgi:hypothetical protein
MLDESLVHCPDDLDVMRGQRRAGQACPPLYIREPDRGGAELVNAPRGADLDECGLITVEIAKKPTPDPTRDAPK